MPKRKVAPPTPNYPWLGGESSIGEIILAMAQELLIEKQNQPNQLAAQLGIYLDGQAREAEFVRQVNAAFAEQELYFERQRKAGSYSKSVNYTREMVAKCKQALIKKGTEVTARAIANEWEQGSKIECISYQQINKYLREMKHP